MIMVIEQHWYRCSGMERYSLHYQQPWFILVLGWGFFLRKHLGLHFTLSWGPRQGSHNYPPYQHLHYEFWVIWKIHLKFYYIRQHMIDVVNVSAQFPKTQCDQLYKQSTKSKAVVQRILLWIFTNSTIITRVQGSNFLECVKNMENCEELV